jgi:anti-sigma regulatory factor (Ser/Thr protein kinase)
MPTASYWARRHVMDLLGRWSLAGVGSLTDDAQLVVSELVTNAVKVTSGLDAESGEQYNEKTQARSVSCYTAKQAWAKPA